MKPIAYTIAAAAIGLGLFWLSRNPLPDVLGIIGAACVGLGCWLCWRMIER